MMTHPKNLSFAFQYAHQGGQSFVSDYIRPVSSLALEPPAYDKLIQVNSFNIDYRPDGQVAQFYRSVC